MPDIPASRLDDKINATKFFARAGMFVDIQPHYCQLALTGPADDISQVQLSPVIKFNLSTWRVCEDTDVAWDLGTAADPSYSPNFQAGVAADNLATYEIDWGDGNSTGVLAYPAGGPPPSGNYGAAAGEWDLAGAAAADFTITITLTDDDGNVTTVEVQIEVIDCSVFPFDGYVGTEGSGIYSATTWTQANGDLSGDWLYVYDIDINYSRRQSGYYQVMIATRAGLAISDNGGASWRRIELSNPTDTWGVGVTAALLSYRKIARDPVNPDVCYVIADYDSGGGNWVGYLLRTSDNWDSHSWFPLGGSYQAVATWGYVQAVSLYYHHRYSSGSPIYAPVSQTNLLGAPNGQYGGARVDFVQRTGAMSNSTLFLFMDIGSYIELSLGSLDGGINVEGTLGASADTMNFVANDMRIRMYTAGENENLSIQWQGSVLGYPPAVPSVQNAADIALYGAQRHFRYVYLDLYSSPGNYTGTGWFRHLFDGFRFYPNAVYPWVRPLHVAVSRGDGRYLYLSTWEGNNICLKIFDTQLSLSLPLYPIQVLASAVGAPGNYQANVITPYSPTIPQRNQKALIHGYWGNWARLRTLDLDPAQPFSNYGYLWNPTYSEKGSYGGINDTAESADWLGEGWFYAIDANSSPYESVDGGVTWTAHSQIGANFLANQQSILIHPDFYGELLVANADQALGDARRVVYSMDDGDTWMDVSAGLPAALDINVVRLLSEVP